MNYVSLASADYHVETAKKFFDIDPANVTVVFTDFMSVDVFGNVGGEFVFLDKAAAGFRYGYSVKYKKLFVFDETVRHEVAT